MLPLTYWLLRMEVGERVRTPAGATGFFVVSVALLSDERYVYELEDSVAQLTVRTHSSADVFATPVGRYVFVMRASSPVAVVQP